MCFLSVRIDDAGQIILILNGNKGLQGVEISSVKAHELRLAYFVVVDNRPIVSGGCLIILWNRVHLSNAC